jgi:hypothetical protein
MTAYSVVIDGVEVWGAVTETYEDIQVFPAEYLDRPTSGAVHLLIDNVVIGVQIPLADEPPPPEGV